MMDLDSLTLRSVCCSGTVRRHRRTVWSASAISAKTFHMLVKEKWGNTVYISNRPKKAREEDVACIEEMTI